MSRFRLPFARCLVSLAPQPVPVRPTAALWGIDMPVVSIEETLDFYKDALGYHAAAARAQSRPGTTQADPAATTMASGAMAVVTLAEGEPSSAASDPTAQSVTITWAVSNLVTSARHAARRGGRVGELLHSVEGWKVVDEQV